MNFKKILFIGIDAFLSFFIIMIALGLGLSFLKIQYYWFAFIIIDGAVSIPILIFMNKAFIKLIRKSGDEEQDNDIEENKSREQEREQSKEPEIKEENEVKERRYIPRKVRIAIIVPILIVGIFIFLEIMFHATSFKGNSVFIPIVSGVVLLFALIFFPLRWYSSYDDEEYEEDNVTEPPIEIKEEKDTEQKSNTGRNSENDQEIIKEDIIEGVIPVRIIDSNEKWKEFKLPKVQGQQYTNSSQVENSIFFDTKNWDVYTIFKEMDMFAPELKNNRYYNLKSKIYMQMDDEDYKYPRVSENDFPDPNEIFPPSEKVMIEIMKKDKKRIKEVKDHGKRPTR